MECRKAIDCPLLQTLDTVLVRNWPENKEALSEGTPRSRPPKVHIGTTVSTTILTDDCNRLLDALNHPQVQPQNPLGVDMELYQVADAATHHGKGWLAAKAVDDFGGVMAQTDAGRSLANTTAVDFADWLLRKNIMSQYFIDEPATHARWTPSSLLEDSEYKLSPFAEFANREPRIADTWSEISEDHLPVVCVVTSAESEYDAVLSRLEPAEGHDCVLLAKSQGVPMLVGKLGKYHITLLQSQSGVDITKRALLQVLPDLPSIRLVMAVGFGYGLDPAQADSPKNGQMIGDIMVSAKCKDLSHYKATDSCIESREDCTSVADELANSFGKPLNDAWSRKVGNWGNRLRPPRVYFGTYVSLPVDFDSEECAHRFAAAAAHHNPIGGDMEVFQIVNAVRDDLGHAAKAWVAIKSIRNFGGLTKKSEECQSLAAATMADFACYILSTGILDHLLDIRQEEKTAIRTNEDMVIDIEANILTMKRLIETNKAKLQPFRTPGVSTAYSKAIEEISMAERVDRDTLLERVNRKRMREVKELCDSLEAFATLSKPCANKL